MDEKTEDRIGGISCPQPYRRIIILHTAVFVVIFYSVVDNPISRQFVGLENFTKVAKNVAFQTAVKNTATFSAIAVPLAVVLSLILAMVLDLKLPFRSQFRTFS